MAAAILILAVALVVIVFHKLYQKNKTSAKDNGLSLDEAGAKAVKIIDDANSKALDIVNKVTLSTDSASEKFKEDLTSISSAQIKEFEKATSDFANIYSQILQDLKIKNVEVFQKVSKDIETNTVEEIKNFKESMQKLTTLSQKEVKRKIDADYSIAKKEIENYKKEELQKIESGIYVLLEKMSKLVLGKALSLTEHEDLIEKSLEKAKKEGLFE